LVVVNVFYTVFNDISFMNGLNLLLSFFTPTDFKGFAIDFKV